MAKRRFGQHFLIDKRAPGRIVRALGIGKDTPVLEIGPGRGALTGPLVQAAGRVVAVEVDPNLAALLRSRFDDSRLHLVVGDVLRVDLDELLEASGTPGSRFLVTGNLPYYISKPIVQRLLHQRERVERAVLMFQREVARRLTARPGSRDFGPLTVIASRYSCCSRLSEVACNRLLMPMMPFIGVRISWLMLARNSLLA